ncbi:unnamed protein product, partial [marine sediment metagenome]
KTNSFVNIECLNPRTIIRLKKIMEILIAITVVVKLQMSILNIA